jgi:HD-GYP domain-containing protein (c-di-GMP phosphodiesterase class II)
VYHLAGSPAGRLAAGLPQQFLLLSLDESISLPAEDPSVLLVDVTTDDLACAERLRSAAAQAEVVALLDPAAPAPTLPAAWYAYLERTVSAPVLAKTIANAYEHMTSRAAVGRLSTELHALNNIGVRLSAERDLPTLLELILTKAREITRSDAGSLYLVESDGAGGRRLRFMLAQNDSINVPFREFTMPLNQQSLAGYAALSGNLLNLEDAYSPPPGSTFQVNRAFDRQIGYRTKSMLVVPMRTPKDEVIGVLQLINCKVDADQRFDSAEQIEREALAFSEQYADFASSLASQAAVALENSRLYENIQILFEGFVKAAVTAIESRDPTTSGHSFRVAELTVGLAETVDRASTGPYADLAFTPDQLQEIRYASLLHDFGKVGVREEVLVKAKKLYPNHIEIIKQRVQLIQLGLELRYSKKKMEYLLQKGREQFAEHSEILDAELAAFLAELDDGLQRVVTANEPAVMPEDFASALQRVALQRFEDHLGQSRTILTPDEAQVLSIPKGSLTADERKQIESHVVHTYQFLAQIPWTAELREIPTIARSHHEKLNGSGYPYGMKSDEIPVQSKMMTISDIYDALTAADRPYKRAMPTERALDILGYERKAGNIDGVLLDLFIEAKVFTRTAAKS